MAKVTHLPKLLSRNEVNLPKVYVSISIMHLIGVHTNTGTFKTRLNDLHSYWKC